MVRAARSVLDTEHSAFIQGAVSISLASRGADNLPNITRGIGCRVAFDRKSITVFVVANQSAGLLADIRANGAIAVIFSHPGSHRSVQFKGTDAIAALATGSDARVLADYCEAFVSCVEKLGFSRPAIQRLLASSLDKVLALTFTPDAAFSQTPGPAAGAPLQVHP